MSNIESTIEKATKLRQFISPVKGETLTPENVRLYIEDKDKSPHLRDYFEVILRRKWIVLGFLLTVVMTVALLSFLTKPLYKATTTLQIKSENTNILTFKDVYQGEMPAEEYYETQYNILKSRNLAKRAVTKLPPEKASEAAPVEGPSMMQAVFGSIFNFGEKPENGREDEREAAQINSFIKRIEIQPIKKSQLINISFVSRDPAFASLAANTLADEYINFSLESKVGPTLVARKRLEEQVEATRSRLEASERQLNDYIARGQIVFLGKKGDDESLLNQKLAELSRELDTATANRISREAVYQEAKRSGTNYNFVLENPLIQALTKDYIGLESQYSSLLNVHKPEYPKMQRLEKQMEDLKKRIAFEEQKIISSLDSDYRIALKREDVLSRAIEGLRREVLGFQQQMVQYQILKREVDTNGELYSSLLTRLKEVDVSTTLSESNIQILDRAEVPGSPFKPLKAQNMALSLIVGLLGGVFFAFFAEYFDNTVKNADDIEKKSRLPVLGLVPISKTDPKALTGSAGPGDGMPFVEAFRTIGTYIQFSNTVKPPKQILVTSPLAKDGKTMFAVNVARSLVKSSRGKGIVVDADLRRATIHSSFDLDNSTGLSSYLSGAIGYDDLIKKLPHLGIDCITSGPVPANPSELFNSLRMKELIDTLSGEYDYVIVDSPPVLGMSDSLVLSAFIEAVIVVVRASNTPADALAQTVKLLRGVNARILGVVLNGLDVGTRYGYPYYYQPNGRDKEGNGRTAGR
ncbi:MAG: polysaccharide biosynthesis tyrosine autokinase [Nitrospiraceae bacterium]|nr:MAG: polysaccharide biosynthesis tyrosine autokinase [Nitrospiraceae bacterium]